MTSVPSLFLSEFPHEQELQETVYGVGSTFKMPVWDPDDDTIDVSADVGDHHEEDDDAPGVIVTPQSLPKKADGPHDTPPGKSSSNKKKSNPGQSSSIFSNPLLTTAASLLAGKSDPVVAPLGFQIGMQVRHPRYGLGQVLTIGHIAAHRTVTVMFDEDGRLETFIVAKCPLQPVGIE